LAAIWPRLLPEDNVTLDHFPLVRLNDICRRESSCPTRWTSLLCGIGLIGLSALCPAQVRAQTSGCLPSDGDAIMVRNDAREMIAPRFPRTTAVRDSVGFTSMDTTKIVMVSDARTCTSIVAGINAHLGTPGRVRRIHVVKMGTQGYLAFEPAMVGSDPRNEWTPTWVITRQFAVRKSIL
jgi:hypothetical protein